jgi:endonuclease YncB( thermonuclease family)
MRLGKVIVTSIVAASAFVVLIPDVDARGRGGTSGGSGYHSYRGAKAIDGDTYRYHGERYRVQQYNAPEIGQPGSRQATKSLQRKLDSGSHEWKPVAKDAYGRSIVRERPAKD